MNLNCYQRCACCHMHTCKLCAHTTEPYPPPVNIHTTNISATQLSFVWNPLTNNESVVTYNINATNCGVCSNSTTKTSIACNSTISENDCYLSVQSEVCGNIRGNNSVPIVVSLRGITQLFLPVLDTFLLMLADDYLHICSKFANISGAC